MKFAILGPIDVVSAAGSAHIGGRRVRTTMGILLLYRNSYVSLEKLVDEMWHMDPPRSAVANIRTYVHQLRRALTHVFGADPLETVPGGYRFNVKDDDLDADHYLRLTDEGHRALANGLVRDAAELLSRALELWRGAPMAGLEVGCATSAKIVALEEHRWRTEVVHLQARLELGQAADIVARLVELVGERPFDESLWQLLMTALAQTGRRGDALLTYSNARRTLTEELGVEPGPSLRDVHQQILSGEWVRAVLPGATIGAQAGQPIS